MLRERLLKKDGYWLLIVVLISVTILITSGPASNLLKKYVDQEDVGRLNIDGIALSFLQDNKRIPAYFMGSSRPVWDQPNSGNEETETKILKRELIKNVTVVSKSGAVYKGFEGRIMNYSETEMLCLSKGAKLPWFEMKSSQFAGRNWIESSVDFMARTIDTSVDIGQEKSEKLMKEFLDKYTPLEFVVIDGNDLEYFNGCLWPNETYYFSANNLYKRFICKNETFDDKGRLIVFYGKTISCELEKITANLNRKYKLLNISFRNVTWITRYLNTGDYARLTSGWSVFEDYEKSGLPLCNYSSVARLVHQEELSLYRGRNAISLCIYPD